MKNLRWSVLVLLMAILVTLTGCGGKYESISVNGYPIPEQGNSIDDPNDLEKNSEQYVITFPLILSPGIWGVESIPDDQNKIFGGVWPVVSSNPSGFLGKKGHAFATEMNFWGDNVAQAMIVGRKSEIDRILYLSRDGHSAQVISGEEIDYRYEKFDKDKNYQTKVFQSGSSIDDIERFWKNYARTRGIRISEDHHFVKEIKIGSPQWDEFKTDLATRLNNNYRMPDGQIRYGFMSLEDFRKKVSKTYGTTPEQRFKREIRIPATIEPVTFSIGVVGSFLNGLIAASSQPVTGYYSIAECKRSDLKIHFQELSDKFKELLKRREAALADLQQENYELRNGGMP